MKSDPSIETSLSAKARARRMKVFAALAQALGLSQIRILDLGGSLEFWRANLSIYLGG